MKKTHINRNHIVPMLFALILLSGGLFTLPGNIDAPPAATADPPIREEVSPAPAPAPTTSEAKLIAVGDIMMHSPQTAAGYDARKKTYNFDSFFSEVKDVLSTGDWVIGNLETPLAGKAFGYSGYPLFNAPPELADALKKAGFTILTTANNHALDRREQGVLQTLKNIRARGLLSTGTAASQAEADRILIVTRNAISMAVLAYTYGTNGIPLPEGKEYLVSLMDERKIIKDIERARKLGADVVTVALHFGVEYERQPNEKQTKLAEQLIKAGADIILGSHPHVVQPFQYVQADGPDGHPRTGIVIYSLGNFISNQTGNFTDYGVIFSLDIVKHFPEQRIELKHIETTPTWVHRYYANGKRNYRVLALQPTINKHNDPMLKNRDYAVMKQKLSEMDRHLHSLLEIDNPPIRQ